MRIANITPPALLQQTLSAEERYHLVLVSQVLGSPEYLAFYQQRLAQGDFVILDNDAFENQGVATPIERLIEAAQLLKPSEIVLPDNFTADAETNVLLAMESISALANADLDMPYMAVPHGTSWRDYLQCVNHMASLPGVETLGIYEEVERDRKSVV